MASPLLCVTNELFLPADKKHFICIFCLTKIQIQSFTILNDMRSMDSSPRFPTVQKYRTLVHNFMQNVRLIIRGFDPGRFMGVEKLHSTVLVELPRSYFLTITLSGGKFLQQVL